MRSILSELNGKYPQIDASAIISKDGLVIESAPQQPFNEDRIAGLSAALYSVGSQSSQELTGGNLDHLILQGSEGYLLITEIGKEAMLTIISKNLAESEFLFEELKQASKKISPFL